MPILLISVGGLLGLILRFDPNQKSIRDRTENADMAETSHKYPQISNRINIQPKCINESTAVTLV